MSQTGFKFRGYIEGFYGRPHTHDERLELLDFLKEIDMNAYMYAPKDDRLHREKWRIPYPAQELHNFKTLAFKAHQCGVDFIYALSPGLSIRFSDKKEFDHLLQKFLQMKDGAGVRHFALLMDDIPGELNPGDKKLFKRPGLAQVDLANRLLEWLKGCKLFFCPTEYCGEFARPSVSKSDYLQDLAGLSSEISVFWTGPGVISETITGENTAPVAKALKRPVVIWDNFHANDYAPMRIFLGPLEGRDKHLPEQAEGYLTNLTEYPRANRIPLYTVAEYARNPAAYRPEKSWDKAVKGQEEEGGGSLALLREFCNSPFGDGPRAQKITASIESGKLTEKEAFELKNTLDALTHTLKDRALFNELYRFKHAALDDLRLYVRSLKVGKKEAEAFGRYYNRRRSRLTLAVDRRLAG